MTEEQIKKIGEYGKKIEQYGNIQSIYELVYYVREISNTPQDTTVMIATSPTTMEVYKKNEALINEIMKHCKDVSPIVQCDNGQGYIVIITGENGKSDFYDEWQHMTKINALFQEQCSWYSITEVQVDILDNISYWAFTFKLK